MVTPAVMLLSHFVNNNMKNIQQYIVQHTFNSILLPIKFEWESNIIKLIGNQTHELTKSHLV